MTLAEAFVIVVQKFVDRLLWQRMRVGSFAAVDRDIHIEPFINLFSIFEVDSDWSPRGAGKWMLVDVTESDSGNDEARTARHELDRFDHPIGCRIPPCPKPVPPSLCLHDFRLPPSGLVETPLVPRN